MNFDKDISCDFEVILPNPIKELGEIHFKEPLKITVTFIDAAEKKVYFFWPCGMEDCAYYGQGSLLQARWGPSLSIEKVVIKHCEFELGHAFFHYNQDPNYTDRHWALYFWLRNDVTLIDIEN